MNSKKKKETPGSSTDIIKDRTAEEQLHLLSSALSSLKDAVYITDLEHNIIYANTAIKSTHGYTPEEVVEKKAYDFFERIPGNPPELAALIAREAHNGFWTGEVFNRRKDGSVFPVQLIVNTIYGKDGEIIGYIGISRDITEIYEGRSHLAESEEHLRTLINATPDIICFKDSKGRWLVANDAIIRLFQLERINYRGKKDSELADSSSFYREAFLACEESDEKAWKKGELSRGEEIIPGPDNTEYVFDVIKVPIFHPDGRRKGLVVLGRDISELKRSEERLREKSKLETVGTMSLGIAHDFNNILMGISGYTQLAYFDVSDQAQVKKACSTILRLIRRAKTMIHRLSTFGRREKLQPQPVDLTRIIDEAISLHERELELSNIRVRRIYKGPTLVMADSSQLGQVFVNLIMNAYHAMIPAGEGVLTVQVDDADGVVEARVTDTGIGIPEDEISLIFQAFFTTKKVEHKDGIPSLGLGLWVSRQIMEEHGGSITVESRRGSGTTFILTIPKTLSVPEQEQMTVEHPARLNNLRERNILVIDDEEVLLNVFEKYLTREGMEVATASRGEEALRLCREGRYEFILLDYVMPGLSGMDLLRQVHKLSPKSRVVIISGRHIPEKDMKELETYTSEVLMKPVELKKLGKILNQLVSPSDSGKTNE